MSAAVPSKAGLFDCRDSFAKTIEALADPDAKLKALLASSPSMLAAA